MTVEDGHRDYRAAEEASESEKRALYISAAKHFCNSAKNIRDQFTQTSLLYLAALSVQKAESATVRSNLSISSVNGDIRSQNGRLSTFSTINTQLTTTPSPETSQVNTI